MGLSPTPSEPTGSQPRLRPRTGGLDTLTKSPPRARPLTRGLGKEPNFHLARGPVRTASNETAILRIAQGWLVNNSSLLPRSVFSDSMSRPINASTTPVISAGRRLDTTEWPTGQGVASTPYRLRQGAAADYRPLCSGAVPTISACTTLCPAIPAPKTTRHGKSHPGRRRLSISTQD